MCLIYTKGVKNKLIIMLKEEKLNTKAGSAHSAKQQTKTSIRKYLLWGILGITLIAYIGVSIYFMKHFYPNSKIGDLDISFKTANYII